MEYYISQDKEKLDLEKVHNEIKTVALRTRDAHGLYEPFGFERVGVPIPGWPWIG